MKFSTTGQEIGDCLIEVTTSAGLIVCRLIEVTTSAGLIVCWLIEVTTWAGLIVCRFSLVQKLLIKRCFCCNKKTT
jgi:hypothetical protein